MVDWYNEFDAEDIFGPIRFVTYKSLKNIANAIRAQTGATNTYKVSEMAEAILGISGGGSDEVANFLVSNRSGLTTYSFPDGTTKIEDYAFSGCSNLELTELPKSITSIGQNAFASCTNLKTVTFKSTPEEIADSAFSNCSNLTTINVPWASGAVAGAPWGATNAVIHYNYTG